MTGTLSPRPARTVASMLLGVVLAAATFVSGDMVEATTNGAWQMLTALVSVAALVSIPWIVHVHVRILRDGAVRD